MVSVPSEIEHSEKGVGGDGAFGVEYVPPQVASGYQLLELGGL